jgi:hypothetical protein
MIIAMVSCAVLGIILFIAGDYICNVCNIWNPVVFYFIGLSPFVIYVIITIIFMILQII